MEPARLSAVVNGDVQGVGFRFFVIRNARTLGLRGWVRNREDGAVEILAEGPRPQLENLLAAVRRGPPGARVVSVDVRWLQASGGLEAFDLTF